MPLECFIVECVYLKYNKKLKILADSEKEAGDKISEKEILQAPLLSVWWPDTTVILILYYSRDYVGVR